MAEAPLSMSIEEIRNYMLRNDGKVTNHQLVSHFKEFLSNPVSKDEARMLFKMYVCTLATVQNENDRTYLVLHKKYMNEMPSLGELQRELTAAITVCKEAAGSCGARSAESGGVQVPPIQRTPSVVASSAMSQATVQNENDQKYLVLNQKYMNEMPLLGEIQRELSAERAVYKLEAVSSDATSTESERVQISPILRTPSTVALPAMPQGITMSATLPVLISSGELPTHIDEQPSSSRRAARETKTYSSPIKSQKLYKEYPDALQMEMDKLLKSQQMSLFNNENE